MQGAPALLEGFVSFTHEVSVIAARGTGGDVACFDPGENVHKDGILDTTTVPANLTASQRMDAVLLAANILNALDYVGVMGVELFVTPQGLIVNEIAPARTQFWPLDPAGLHHRSVRTAHPCRRRLAAG